ncbi:hypothetical protein JRQ81_005658 [Phrynocephalus forsythii]|uniref:Uncharacterized protein n=1 Tax=Phrynocephalus forsythii TaxID=171643 RepID=A0A9Q0XIH1_9SAUR|nr:hypothetical protein JRQ81_005658 [Phrynocephalus forsythii]
MEAYGKMVERNQLELEEGEDDEEAEKMYQEEPDMTVEKEGLQQAVLVEAQTQEEQQEAMERKDEIARSHQWELKRKSEDPEGSKVGQEREQEILSSNEKVQQGESCQGQFVGEQQRGLEGVIGPEDFQYGGLEKGEEEEEAEAEEKEGMAVKVVVQQLKLSEAEVEREHIEVVEGESGRNHQWEVEEMGLLEDLQDRKPKEVADTREGHQGELDGSEELERHREEEPEEPERNKVDVKGKEEEEQTGDVILESDQREELEILADVSSLDEEELGEITSNPEQAERSLQLESTAHSPSLEEDLVAGCRVFPSKVSMVKNESRA